MYIFRYVDIDIYRYVYRVNLFLLDTRMREVKKQAGVVCVFLLFYVFVCVTCFPLTHGCEKVKKHVCSWPLCI